jgi:hypothetical protein
MVHVTFFCWIHGCCHKKTSLVIPREVLFFHNTCPNEQIRVDFNQQTSLYMCKKGCMKNGQTNPILQVLIVIQVIE